MGDVAFERRVDGKFSKMVKQPSGAVRAPALLTRTGVFVYHRADGTKVRELRHPDEVFKADSLATLQSAAVTIGHPPKGVTPESWQNLSVGTVGDDIREDTDKPGHVHAPITVHRADAIEAVMSDELSELSCGYRCDIDETPGVWNGERYDARQINPRYNHVALLPKGRGRAGSAVALRLDSTGNQIDDDSTNRGGGDKLSAPKPHEVDAMVIRVDGVDYDPAKDPQGLKAAIERQDGKHAAELASAKTKAETEKVRADAADKKLVDATDPKSIQARVDARASIVTDAKALAGDKELKVDGLTDAEIQSAAVGAKMGDGFVKDKSAEFVSGVFAALAKDAREDSADESKRTQRDDTLDVSNALAAGTQRTALPAPTTPAWQQPLSVSHN